MKQETKELIESLQLVLLNWGKENPYDKDIVGKGISFLKSIPEIESHLCRGGYIQDRNGTPCCDRDKVKVIRGGGLPPHITTLRFDTEIKGFVIGMPVFGEDKEVNMWLERNEFEKVEE